MMSVLWTPTCFRLMDGYDFVPISVFLFKFIFFRFGRWGSYLYWKVPTSNGFQLYQSGTSSIQWKKRGREIKLDRFEWFLKVQFIRRLTIKFYLKGVYFALWLVGDRQLTVDLMGRPLKPLKSQLLIEGSIIFDSAISFLLHLQLVVET